MSLQELTSLIAGQIPRLSPQLQIAARYVLERPDEVALASMRTLAFSAGVKPSTMVRLSKGLGFDSFNAFREPFQDFLKGEYVGFTDRARTLQSHSDSAGKLVGETLDSCQQNLEGTFSINTPNRFIDCAKEISTACNVYVIGLRSCYPVASYFHYLYNMFMPNAMLLDGTGGVLADSLRSFGKGDVLLAISFHPYTLGTVSSVEYAKEKGGKIIAITDTPTSPLAASADQSMFIDNASPSFFHSSTSAMAVVETLAAVLLARGGERAIKSLGESENQLQQFNAYWLRASEQNQPNSDTTQGRSR